MSQTSTPHTQPARRSPVRNLNSRQMRAVRKELLILRAEVERTEFAQARHELRHSLASFGWLKLLVPGFAAPRSRGGKGLNASITDWVANHPLASSLASLVLARPLRATLSAGAKPLFKWGSLGAAAWTGYRLVAQILRQRKSGDATAAGSGTGESPAAH